MKNKRGAIPTEHLFLFIIISLLAIIILGTFLYVYNAITTSLLSPDIAMAGSVNFTNATQLTMGKINTAMLSHANLISIIFLFAMVIAIFFFAYITRDQSPAVFMVIDIIVVIFAYILAVYITNSYETVLSNIPFSSIFTTNLNLATTFLLRLPVITLVVGAISIIIAYSAIPKTKEEEVAGY